MIRVKICCMQSIEEMHMAVAAGASAIGLVSAMPSGLGPISEGLIAEIASQTPSGIGTFLLTSLQDAEGIIAQQRRCGTNTVQIVDRLNYGTHAEIRSALPGIKIVQVIHVNGPEAVEEAKRLAPHVDALLLDSGRPQATVKELGGTGRIHDWSISRRIVESVPIPVYLAGGLTPDNVAEAIRAVRPFAVDVCSGLRINSLLDEAKLQAFCKLVINL